MPVLELLQAELGHCRIGFLQHGLGHINADHMAGRANGAGGDDGIHSGTRADIHDVLAVGRHFRRQRVPHTRERGDHRIRDPLDPLLLVAVHR